MPLVGGRTVFLLDSITEVAAEHAGQIVVSGSHGGRSAALYAARFPLALCCLNDAGVGKDRAGIVALDLLEQRGIPAVTCSHTTARIGEAQDAWEQGVVSHVNSSARALGLHDGERLRDAIERVFPAGN